MSDPKQKQSSDGAMGLAEEVYRLHPIVSSSSSDFFKKHHAETIRLKIISTARHIDEQLAGLLFHMRAHAIDWDNGYAPSSFHSSCNFCLKDVDEDTGLIGHTDECPVGKLLAKWTPTQENK